MLVIHNNYKPPAPGHLHVVHCTRCQSELGITFRDVLVRGTQRLVLCPCCKQEFNLRDALLAPC